MAQVGTHEGKGWSMTRRDCHAARWFGVAVLTGRKSENVPRASALPAEQRYRRCTRSERVNASVNGKRDQSLLVPLCSYTVKLGLAKPRGSAKSQ